VTPADLAAIEAREQTKQSGWATLQLTVATAGTIGAALLAPNYAPWAVLAGLGSLIIHKGSGLLHAMIGNRKADSGNRVTPIGNGDVDGTTAAREYVAAFGAEAMWSTECRCSRCATRSTGS